MVGLCPVACPRNVVVFEVRKESTKGRSFPSQRVGELVFEQMNHFISSGIKC